MNVFFPEPLSAPGSHGAAPQTPSQCHCSFFNSPLFAAVTYFRSTTRIPAGVLRRAQDLRLVFFQKPLPEPVFIRGRNFGSIPPPETTGSCYDLPAANIGYLYYNVFPFSRPTSSNSYLSIIKTNLFRAGSENRYDICQVFCSIKLY